MKPTKNASPSEDDRLRWLLDFLQRDLETLRPGERLDLLEDCARLLSMRDPAIDLAAVDPPDGYALALKGEAWPDASVIKVQAALRAGVAKLEAGQSWQPFEKPLTPVFTVGTDQQIVRRYRGSYEGIMLASAVDLLVAGWPRIRRCGLKTCRRLFLPSHGRQEFHETKCANLARDRKRRNYVQEEERAAQREWEKKKKTRRHK